MLKTRSYLYNDSPVVQRWLIYLLLIIWTHLDHFKHFKMIFCPDNTVLHARSSKFPHTAYMCGGSKQV